MIRPWRWVLPARPPAEVESFAERLSITRPAARVLWRRGYRDAESARRFLRPSLADLHDPFLLPDMEKAVDRLRRAIADGEKILLYGDYDADGSTSIAILKKAIDLAGGRCVFHVPDRFLEGYGMRTEVMERAAKEGVTLVISVDTGIRAAGAVIRAGELGMDVVITDHHLPDAGLPPALAAVNPNRPDCSYPDRHLCGAGVVLKLIQALFAALGWEESRRRRMLESFVKMVAIATVADVVPLVGENRILVRHGLEGLRCVHNPGLRALLDVAGFREGERPTAGQVAFRVAPRINAAGRMASARDVVDLFLTSDAGRARELASQLHVLNQQRQQTEAAILDLILRECARTPVTDEQAALVFHGKGWHPGVVGIVAARLVERFHRPVFVLSVDEEAEEARGSGRSIPSFHLLEALESMAGLFTRFGGHRQAAGLSLPVERIGEFRRRLSAYAASRLGTEDLQPVREIDARLEFSEITGQSAADVLALRPFGFGNPAPLFAIEKVKVASQPVIFKEKHLRVRLLQNGRAHWATGWNLASRAGELGAGKLVDVVVSFEDDPYSAARGYPGWALVLKDVRPSRD